jgi:hypothetical protein
MAQLPLSLEIRRKLIEVVDDALSEANVLNCCVNCKKFNEQTEICSKWNARPPARVITFGCELFDMIPDKE